MNHYSCCLLTLNKDGMIHCVVYYIVSARKRLIFTYDLHR